ncbi:transposase-like protein [Roseovarius sp. MBR-51]
MIDPTAQLSASRQAVVLGISRGSVYYKPRPDSDADLKLLHLHDIWQAKTKAAFDLFVETYGVKYECAVAKRVKDRDELLAFYDFLTEHWKQIRNTNRI